MPRMDGSPDVEFLRRFLALETRVRAIENGNNKIGTTYRASDGARITIGRQSDGSVGIRVYDSGSNLIHNYTAT